MHIRFPQAASRATHGHDAGLVATPTIAHRIGAEPEVGLERCWQRRSAEPEREAESRVGPRTPVHQSTWLQARGRASLAT